MSTLSDVGPNRIYAPDKLFADSIDLKKKPCFDHPPNVIGQE